MDQWAIRGGGGGTMKFWKHKKNIAKHLVRLLGDYTTAAEHGDTLRDEYDKSFPEKSVETFPKEVLDSILLLYHHYKIYKNINGIQSKDIDSSFTKIPIKGSLKNQNKLKDSIQFHNDNLRASGNYWLKNK